MEAALHPWPALGALVVRDGLVSKSTLAAVLARQHFSGEQRISGKRLGELLVERGLVTAAQVARLLAEQYELPFVELDGSDVNLQAATLLSEELARRFSALPISRLPDDSVLVAVADPTSVLYSDDLRLALGAPLRFAVAAPEKLDAAITFAHQQPLASIERVGTGDAVVADAYADEGLAAQLAERAHESTFGVERRVSPAWPPLGALLIRDGRMSEEELEAAVGPQRVSGSKRLGELLVERGLVTREQVARLLAEQYELPFVEITEFDEEPKAAAVLPGEIARRYSALPLRVSPDGSLFVAVSDPTNALYADELRAALGVPLHFAVAAPDALAAAIARIYEETPGTPDAAVDTVVGDHPDGAVDGASAADASAFGEIPGARYVDEVDEIAAAVDWVENDATSTVAARQAESDSRADLIETNEGVESRTDTFVDDAPAAAADEVAIVAEADEVEDAIDRALSLGASDIHFTPQAHAVVVRARIDGVMRELGTIPSSKQAEVVARLKLFGQLDSEEWRAPQDGRLEIRRGEDSVDLRIVVLPTKRGEKVTLHLLHQASRTRSLADLGMAVEGQDSLRRALQRPSGVVLVCGPTGSGCTTTLYAALQELNTPERTLATIEDPVEHLMQGIDQTEVDPVAGLTLVSGLRAILGSDPDVILVGEMRDDETAQVAVRAAMTGCLVLSALHVESAAAAIERLTDLGVEPGLLGATLTCVIAQRLTRRVCIECRESYYATPAELSELGLGSEELGRRLLARGPGCAACGGTGYHGRVALFEVLSLTGEVQELVTQRASIAEIQHAAIRSGMRTLRHDGIRLCLEGMTTAAEVRRVVGDRDVSGSVFDSSEAYTSPDRPSPAG